MVDIAIVAHQGESVRVCSPAMDNCINWGSDVMDSVAIDRTCCGFLKVNRAPCVVPTALRALSNERSDLSIMVCDLRSA